MKSIVVPLAAAATLAAIVAASSAAHACSCVNLQDRGFIAQDGGRLPSNAQGVAWYGHTYDPSTLSRWFKVEMLVGNRFRALPARTDPVDGFRGVYLIAPEGDGLRPGSTYRFTVGRAFQLSTSNHRVSVTVDSEPLAATTELGLVAELPVLDTIRVAASDGSCQERLRASQYRIEAELPQHAEPWRDQLLWRTLIEGTMIWSPSRSLCSRIPPGRSWESVGADRVYAACGPPPGSDPGRIYYDPGLSPGRHTVMMQAILPGTGVILETPAISVVQRCP